MKCRKQAVYAVHQFLSALGIQKRSLPTEKGTSSAITEASWCKEGFDSQFESADAARAVLSVDHGRFLLHLQDFGRIEGFPASPKRIAELGGGTGIHSLWLAHCHPEATATVYDYAENTLRVGRQFAQELKLNNIGYELKAHSDLAIGNPTHDCDLVLAYNCVILHSAISDSEKTEEANAETEALFRAISNLLTDDGIGVISNPFPYSSLPYVFETLRNVGLRLLMPYMVQEHGRQYIFVSRSCPHINANSKEDMLSSLTGTKWNNPSTLVDQEIIRVYTELFCGGRELLRIEHKIMDQSLSCVRLRQSAGLVFCNAEIANCPEIAEVGSIGLLNRFVEAMMRQARNIVQQEVICTVKVHPALDAWCKYWGIDLRLE